MKVLDHEACYKYVMRKNKKTLLFHLNVKHLYSMLNTLSTTSSTIAAAGAAGNGMNAASLMLRSEANQKEVDELHKRLSVLTEDIVSENTKSERESEHRVLWKSTCRFSISIYLLPSFKLVSLSFVTYLLCSKTTQTSNFF